MVCTTLRWREMDSNFRSPATGTMVSFELSGRLLREQDWRSEMSLAPAPDLPCPRGPKDFTRQTAEAITKHDRRGA